MPLIGQQVAQIRDALLEAFTNDTLSIMVRIELNQRLDVIAGGQNLSIVAFNLVSWAEQSNRIEDLIQGACRANPGSPQLQELLADSRTWPTTKPAPGPQSAALPGARQHSKPATPASAPATSPASIDIFLSYSRTDAESMRAVQDILRAAGLTVWTDEGLDPGTPSWVAAIQEAIEQANAFVALLSPAAKASAWINREISYAEAQRKRIVPVLVTGDVGSAVPINLINTQWMDGRQNLGWTITQHILPVLVPNPVPVMVDPRPALQASSAQPDPPTPVAPKLPHMLEGHTGAINSIAFSPDGHILASGSHDWTVRLWKVATGELLQTLEGHMGSVNSVAFDSKGSFLASGSHDRTIRLWDASLRKPLRTLEGHIASVSSVTFNPKSSMLASGSSDKTVRLWYAPTGELLARLEGQPRGIGAIAFSTDGRILASGGNDCAIQLWDLATGNLLATLRDRMGVIYSVAFSPDNSILAIGCEDNNANTVRLWDVHTLKPLACLKGHTNSILSVTFSSDNYFLASGSWDTTIRLWKLSTGKLLRTLEGHTLGVSSVALTPDGRILASGSYDQTVRLWSVQP